LVRGTLKDCLSFDVENFITPLPALLGLGNYPLEGNYAEGIIVRHNLHRTPGFDARGHTTCLKVRCSAFMEMKHPGKQAELQQEMVYQLQKQAGGKIGVQSETVLPEAELAALAVLRNYICKSRAVNAISKVGILPLQKGVITAEQFTLILAKDVLKDFLRCSEDIVLNTAVTFRKQLITHCYMDTKKFVTENWAELLRADATGNVTVDEDDELDAGDLDVRASRDADAAEDEEETSEGASRGEASG
jgi:RNA-editing ligase